MVDRRSKGERQLSSRRQERDKIAKWLETIGYEKLANRLREGEHRFAIPVQLAKGEDSFQLPPTPIVDLPAAVAPNFCMCPADASEPMCFFCVGQRAPESAD